MVDVGSVRGDSGQRLDNFGCASEKMAEYSAPLVPKLRLEAARSEEEANLIRRFVPPKLVIPYPVKVNKYSKEAVAETEEWLIRNKLHTLFEAGDFERFLKEELTRQATCMFGNAGRDEMCHAAEMTVWLFVADHLFDDCELGMIAESLLPLFLELNIVLLSLHPDDRVLYDNMMKTVDEFLPPTSSKRPQTLDFIQTQLHNARTIPGYESTYGPLSTALLDLLTVSKNMATETANLRLARKVQIYLIGNFDESNNRERKAVLGTHDYILERRRAGAVEILWTLIEHVFHLDTSDELFAAMQQLSDAHNDILCWQNDVFSFKKEALKGDCYNMVFLVSRELKMSYDDAAVYTNKMITDRIADFDRASQELRETFKHSEYSSKVVATYIETGQNFISGNDVFCAGSNRYK